MHLICPACGAIASAEIWQNDPAMRQVLDIISKLPGPVAIRALPYLGLFRKGKKRVLAWPTAVKLATDLQQLVCSGRVQWDGCEERPAPPELWARIMDQMIAAHKDGLNDHNYLRKSVWSEARGLAAKAEAGEEAGAGHRYFQPDPETPAQKKKSCWTCASRGKPPKMCTAGHKPVGGNDHLGCNAWSEKAAAIAEVMGELVSNLPVASLCQDAGSRDENH